MVAMVDEEATTAWGLFELRKCLTVALLETGQVSQALVGRHKLDIISEAHNFACKLRLQILLIDIPRLVIE